MTSTFDAFLRQAWADHADYAEAVAQRLRIETPAPESAKQLAALIPFVVHLCGEHLGNFDDARWRLAALQRHPLADAGVQSALRTGDAALTLAESGIAVCEGFTPEERVRSEASAAAICIGRKQTARAMSLLRTARERIATWPDAGSAIHRPLAIALNNMMWELHDRADTRSAADTAAMLDIAAACKLHWSHAGTWLEVERADYGLALCHLSAREPKKAAAFAEQCLAACEQHAAPPYEQFFAHEALTRACHACGDGAACARHALLAEAAFMRLSSDDQEGCRPALARLKALA